MVFIKTLCEVRWLSFSLCAAAVISLSVVKYVALTYLALKILHLALMIASVIRVNSLNRAGEIGVLVDLENQGDL